MQKILLVLFLLAITLSVKAQRITYLDLRYALYHNVEDTENNLSKKGFSFAGIDTLDESEKAYSYLFTKNPYKSSNYIGISKKTFHNIFNEVSLYTLKQDDYLKLKSYIRSIGYNLILTKTTDIGGIVYTYIHNSNKMEFMVTRKMGNEYTEYYISLTDTALSDPVKQ